MESFYFFFRNKEIVCSAPTLCKYVEVEKDEKDTLENSEMPKPNNK